MELTSASLLHRLQGSPAHHDWQRFVELYEPFIRRFIRLEPRLAADADDLCQEVMKKIVEHLPEFRRQRDGSFRAWLRTVTVREVNLYWRQRLGRPQMQAPADDAVLDGLREASHPLSQMWDREHADHVVRRLQELIEPEFTPTSWQAFRMRVLEQRSTAEVAQALGISANAVDIAKSRVLSRLRLEAAGMLDEIL
ncbi:MAG: sigma-70 family RNA polymerase sigma factor [Pirellulales bacterium]|nr:sigma-70 family RNA polymerase sigma factor [Pirellulales bacterium]